jgi:hypothetical protein
MHRIKTSLTVLALLSVVGYATPFRDGSHPIVVGIDPGYVTRDETVQVTVGMDQAPDVDEALTISSSGSNFSSLPSTVTVLAGHSSVTFDATVSSTASGSLVVTATYGGQGATSSPVPISN